MIDCATIGDSIAVGIQQINRCELHAKGGRSTRQQAIMAEHITTGTAIISLGSNDPDNAFLLRDLRTVRSNVKANIVVWIVPYNARAGALVRQTAFEFGDRIIELVEFASRDRVHPNNYGTVARLIGVK